MIRLHQGDTGGREYHREVQESETGMVWTCEETIPKIRRKTDTGDGATWEKRRGRPANADLDGLCQPRPDTVRMFYV